jgi:hypothetical protein
MYALIFIIAVMVSGLKCAIADIKCMSSPYRFVNGTPIYRNRKGHDCLASGELVYWNLVRDYYGGYTHAYVTASGKVLNDPKIEQKAKEDKKDKESLERSLQRGDKAYTKYYPEYHERILTDIETGRKVWAFESDADYREHTYHLVFYDGWRRTMADKAIRVSREEYMKYKFIS